MAPTQSSINHEFSKACHNGKIKDAILLLNSTTNKFHPDERTVNQAVIETYFLNKIKVMKFLLELDEISKKPDLNYKNNLLFRSIYADKEYSLLNYLIFELKIDKTARIIEDLKENPDKRVTEMFLIRELNTELLVNKSRKNKRIKV